MNITEGLPTLLSHTLRPILCAPFWGAKCGTQSMGAQSEGAQSEYNLQLNMNIMIKKLFVK